MKYYWLVILCISSILTSCYNKQLSQDELSNKLNNDWCNCMQKESKEKTPEEIISQVTVNCIQNVMLQYTQDKQLNNNIRALVAAKGYDNTLSDYEKERLFGRELGEILMRNAVDNCVVYRQSLIQFKKYYIEKAKQEMDFDDKIEVDEWINKVQAQLDEIDISKIENRQAKKQISNYYLLLGLLYENINKNTLAVRQYDKAIQIDPENTNAIGFKKLLVEYKND